MVVTDAIFKGVSKKGRKKIDSINGERALRREYGYLKVLPPQSIL